MLGADVSSPGVLNIEDLRSRARNRLPAMVFNYIDSGADREQTLSQNCNAYNEILSVSYTHLTLPTKRIV